MSTLKEKSNINIKAASALASDEETCLSSVHCDYYSCFQLIIFYLDTVYGYDDRKRKEEYDEYVYNGVGRILGSHEYWINEFYKKVKEISITNSNIIDRNIKILKENRMEADYQTTDFPTKKTKKLYVTACDTIRLIDQSFKAI